MMKRTIEASTIRETLYLNGLEKLSYDNSEKLYNYVNNFCIDKHGRVRKSLGIVNTVKDNDDNLDFVPSFRYEIESCPWNSHSQYICIELPNPATDFNEYQLIRGAFLTEIEKRLNSDVRKLS